MMRWLLPIFVAIFTSCVIDTVPFPEGEPESPEVSADRDADDIVAGGGGVPSDGIQDPENPAPSSEAPDTSLDDVPPAESDSAAAQFEFSATMDACAFYCQLDSEPFEVCESPHLVTLETEGMHTFSVYAVSPDGQEDPTPASYIWIATPAD